MIKKGFEIFQKCKDDNIGAYAAQSAFFIILSAIPFLMVMLCLLKYTFIEKSDLLDALQNFLPNYLLPLIISIVDEVYEKSTRIISITVIAAIWSAAKGMQYITNGLNAVYDLKENRNWFVLRFWAIIYTLIFTMALLFLLGFMVFEKYLRGIFFANFDQRPLWLFFRSWLKWIIALAGLVGFFEIIYTALPNTKLKFKNQLIGSCFTAIGWFVFSIGLSIYVNYFDGFSMYGSLTTLVLLMLWIYFCVYIMLIGAELNAYFSNEGKTRIYIYRTDEYRDKI